MPLTQDLACHSTQQERAAEKLGKVYARSQRMTKASCVRSSVKTLFTPGTYRVMKSINLIIRNLTRKDLEYLFNRFQSWPFYLSFTTLNRFHVAVADKRKMRALSLTEERRFVALAGCKRDFQT